MSGRTAGDFDFIIVGAGSAGCVLANRLSADPGTRVALLEAGGRDDSFFIRMPIGYGKIAFEPGLSWHYFSQPEPGLDGRRVLLPRGKALGGSSNINGLLYVRGQSEDYADWVSAGASGWGWDDVLPWFRQSVADDADGALEGSSRGCLRVQRATARDPTNDAVLRAFARAGTPIIRDFNEGEQWGCGYYDVNIHRGERWSVARSYLRAAERRGNLRIFTDALARRVIVSAGRAIGVEFERGGERLTVSARREVVLCAGAYQSPQLLQLSGIGDPALLGRHGLEVVHSSPGVGQGLQDHFVVPVGFRVRDGVFSYNHELTGWPLLRNFLRYVVSRDGPMTIPAAQTGAFVRSSAAALRPDIQFHCLPVTGDLEVAARGGKGKLSKYPGLTLAPCVLRPKSRGSVCIESSDPTRPPQVLHNYLVDELDQALTIRGMRIARELAATEPLASLIEEEADPGIGAIDDAALLGFARSCGSTGYHPAGTCRMGSDAEAVVDPQLRVRGIAGLRVADASIMPTLISGNTNAACVMIGERAADFILKEKGPVVSDRA